ncbi:HypC/HybG/HupF family hydrogenase formation chaperone [Pectobacterium atrosepticum]|uniref:HypC/HybG/HupF family hydrogenase formation chaperone n=1 Tax=Pectobacterium atrosepticum TaxID=29471 RepID=UPI000CDE4744|nr:HypC/HybG/HupF family hydrogenase formation chaperone [Pectobacterium atrosepticum]POW31079.1 hydrogenase assembly chaperone [Pectobacterium atrosepticum]
MCIGVPGQVKELIGDSAAWVDVCGIRREVNMLLVGAYDDDGQSQIDQWVLVHVGFAMSVIDEQEALNTLEILQKMFGVEPDVGVLLYGEDQR